MANPHEPHFFKPLLPGFHRDMVFHVTPFGPSCCEIQYTDPDIIKEEADAGDADDNEISKFQSKFIVLVVAVVRCFDVEFWFFYFRRNKGDVFILIRLLFFGGGHCFKSRRRQTLSSCGSYAIYCFEQTMPRDNTCEKRGKLMDCEFAI
ncbi:unnamed protein product [Brassica oleracea var. botrytis]